MKLVFALLSLVLSTGAFAIAGGCKGMHEGKEVLAEGYGEGNDPRNVSGTVTVDGQEVARFDGQDASINFLLLRGKVTNEHGDIVEAKVTSMTALTGTVTRLYVPAHGIDYRNIAMNCWMSK